jgi:hypothetical protein
VIGPLDTWLGRAFDPANLRATLNQLAAQAAVGNDDISARTEAAKARIVAFNSKIAQYRASLDAGGDPPVDHRDPSPASRRTG